MANWPPAPSVEDETTALAKEHGSSQCIPESIEEQPVPSRGAPDQMPVIVDSSTSGTEPLGDQVKMTPAAPIRTIPEAASTSVHDDSGLPTPPPSDSEATRGRLRPTDSRKTGSASGQDPRSRSAASTTDTRQSRPSISRIQTDVSDTSQPQSFSRRAPSPYAYTPESGTFKIDAVPNPTRIELISALKTTNSPTSDVRDSATSHKYHRYSREYDSSTDSESKPKKSLRFAETQQGPAEPPHSCRSSSDFKSGHRKAHEQIYSHRNTSTVKSGKHADEDEVSGKSVPGREDRSRGWTSRSSSRARDSPNSSSAEDRSISDHAGSTKKSGSNNDFVQRHTYHRHERPQLEQILTNQSSCHSELSNLDDDAMRHGYRVSRSGYPMTPPAVTTPHHMEDYFSRAFQDNALKKSRHTPRPSKDETAVYSPPTSPPRTPRSERPPRQEYFESPVSSPRGTPRHSRTPSVDESVLRELIELKEHKPHTNSLLSQATITAAAIAITKTSPPLSRSATNAIETTFACSNNVTPSRPRSRASSPQRERLQRADTFTYGDHVMPQVSCPTVPQSKRPNTRDGLAAPSHPQRTASWAGHDPKYTSHSTQYGAASHHMTTMSTVQSAQSAPAPLLQRTQSTGGPQEYALAPEDFALPPCPRSSPTQGLRDWSTFKDFTEPSICPKCAHALSSTKFRSQLIRSRDKPYDRLTTCALSRPWIRIAIMESVKRSRSDLALIKKANMLPEGARACEGNRPDIRTWWKLIDPATERAVPDFFACSACVGSVHQIFPDLPDVFKRDVLNQEKVCGLREDSKNFKTLTDHLAQIAAKCRDRGRSSSRYMQPFVDQVRRNTRYSECKRDTLSSSLVWHFAPDLPEFTMCEHCYHEVVFPVEDKPFARDISKVLVLVPLLNTKGPVVKLTTAKGTSNVGTQLTSCQLYSERMRRLFNDVVTGKISYESFKARVKERHALQYRLTEMNRLYEEDQKMGLDRRSEIEKNKAFWRSLE